MNGSVSGLLILAGGEYFPIIRGFGVDSTVTGDSILSADLRGEELQEDRIGLTYLFSKNAFSEAPLTAGGGVGGGRRVDGLLAVTKLTVFDEDVYDILGGGSGLTCPSAGVRLRTIDQY